MGNNGDERKKKCPFLNDWCIGEACAISTEMAQNTGGVLQKFTMCSFSALVMMISEINAKTPPPLPQKIQIPKLFIG